MKKRNSKIILKIILICTCLLFICIFSLFKLLEKKEKEPSNIDFNVMVQKSIKTIPEVLEKHNARYIDEEFFNIYVNFQKFLFEDGKSNQKYFEEIVDELYDVEKLKENSFTLIDEEKNITIEIIYNNLNKSYKVVYNHEEDFFEITDGKVYSKLLKVEVPEETRIYESAKELKDLIKSNMFFRGVKDYIGEGIQLENNYTSYKDGSILIKSNNDRVISVIFTSKYEENVFSGIKVGTSLEEIKEKLKTEAEGSIEEGYLMYRTNDIYTFFYKDEIVIYGYSYFENVKFEGFLEEYLNNGDFDKFITKTIGAWKNYDICEYNLEEKTAYITYPTRGVEINIRNNDPRGIIFYKNYYFSEKTKKYVTENKISLNDEVNYIELIELNRRRLER